MFSLTLFGLDDPKWHHCHAISQVYGLIMSVIQSWCSFTFFFIIIGFFHQCERKINLYHLMQSKWNIS